MMKRRKHERKTVAWKERARSAFTWERSICRVIASWCLYAMLSLLLTKGDFFDLSFAQDNSTGLMIALIVLFFGILSALSLALPSLETDSWFLMGSATVCVLRWLSVFENDIVYQATLGKGNMTVESDKTLFLLATLAVYLLFVFYFVQKNHALFDRIRLDTKTVWIIVGVVGVASGAVIGVTTCLRYLTFSSPNFDFGLFVNMFHNMLKTGLPLTSAERDVLLTHFAVHLSPIYYTILPIYAVFQSPLTLQIVQALLVASGIVPAILLAKHFGLSGRTQALVAFIYAFYPATAMGCFYDFHENCFLLPLLLWMFYFFEREQYIPMYVFAALTLTVKEDAAVYIILFAIYAMVSRKKLLHGAILAASAILYFGIALTVLENTAAHWAEHYASIGETPNPSIAGPMINRFNNLIADSEDGLAGAVLTALKNPGYLLTQLFSTDGQGLDSFFVERSPWAKVVYLLQMLLPVGMLPFCTKKQSRWLLIAPILLNVLTVYKYQYSINFQYHFGITAFLMYAMIQNLPDLAPVPRRKLLAFGAAATLCIYIFTVMPHFNRYVKRWDESRDRFEYIESILDELPEDASLCVPGSYLAHVADRREVYEHTYHASKAEHIKEDDVDYAVIRKGSDDRYRQNFESKGYTVWKEYSDHVILQKPQPQT